MMENRSSTRRQLLSILLYGAASLVPPLLVGSIVALKVVGDWMEVSASEPLVGQWPELSYSPGIDPTKPTAAVVLSNGGTETTDLLAPYAVLLSIAEQHSNSVARAVAKTVQYPVKHIEFAGAAWPLRLLLIPLAIGIVSLFGARWTKRRWQARKQPV